MTTPGTTRQLLSPRGRRQVGYVMVLWAVVGLLLGLETVVVHLSSDPLIDIRRYWLAGARLNDGLPLYGLTSADTTATYLYPPLLAILFRPLALLPFEVAAAIWEAVVLAAFALTVVRIRPGRNGWILLGIVALPIGWTLSIGQVESVLTWLLAVGSPWSVALAGHVKLLPWLAAAYWVGRRDVRSLARFAAWVAGLGLVQLVLAPGATLDYLRLSWLHATLDVNQVSLWVVHPALWAAGALVALVVALRLARGRWGWAAAVALTVAANPRLLVYQLMALVAGLAGPRDRDAAAERAAEVVAVPS
jgi:hypothetical protein